MTLHWEHCHKWEQLVLPTQCAVLQDRVMVMDFDNRLLISTGLQSWSTATPPYQFSSLTTYQSKFVLVGGQNRSTKELTNLLWTSTTGRTWKTSLPAMPTKRCSPTSVSGGSPEVLVVAGGRDTVGLLNVVEVLLDNHWTTAESLPSPFFEIWSTFNEGKFYFTGSYSDILYTCSSDSLTDRTTTQPVWKEMVIPGYTYAIASNSSGLISIDENSTLTSYSTRTRKWAKFISVGVLPVLTKSYTCLTVLSTGHLLIANEDGVFKGTSSDSSGPAKDQSTATEHNIILRKSPRVRTTPDRYGFSKTEAKKRKVL